MAFRGPIAANMGIPYLPGGLFRRGGFTRRLCVRDCCDPRHDWADGEDLAGPMQEPNALVCGFDRGGSAFDIYARLFRKKLAIPGPPCCARPHRWHSAAVVFGLQDPAPDASLRRG